jgi:hypothetical protein
LQFGTLYHPKFYQFLEDELDLLEKWKKFLKRFESKTMGKMEEMENGMKRELREKFFKNLRFNEIVRD